MKYTNEKSNEKSNLVVSETETEDNTIPTSSSDTQENSTTKNTITQDDAVASGTSSIPLPAILDTNSCEVRSQNKYPLTNHNCTRYTYKYYRQPNKFVLPNCLALSKNVLKKVECHGSDENPVGTKCGKEEKGKKMLVDEDELSLPNHHLSQVNNDKEMSVSIKSSLDEVTCSTKPHSSKESPETDKKEEKYDSVNKKCYSCLKELRNNIDEDILSYQKSKLAEMNNKVLKEVTEGEIDPKHIAKISDWSHIHDFFCNKDIKVTDEYWEKLMTCPNFPPIYGAEETFSYPIADEQQTVAFKSLYFPKYTAMRYVIMLLSLNRRCREESIQNIMTLKKKEEMDKKISMLTSAIIILFEYAFPEFLGNSNQRALNRDMGDPNDVYQNLMIALTQFFISKSFCGFIETKRHCMVKNCNTIKSVELFISHQFPLDNEEGDYKFVPKTWKGLPQYCTSKEEVDLLSYLRRSFYQRRIDRRCPTKECESNSAVAEETILECPQLLWLVPKRAQWVKGKGRTHKKDIVRINKKMTLSHTSYRIRSIIIFDTEGGNEHYLVYTSVPYKNDEYIWLEIDDGETTIVDFDVTLDVTIAESFTQCVYEKYTNGQEGIPNNYFDKEKNLSKKDKDILVKEKKKLEKQLKLCPELKNRSTTCFINVTFQALSFLNLEDKHENLNIGDHIFEDSSLLSFFVEEYEKYACYE